MFDLSISCTYTCTYVMLKREARKESLVINDNAILGITIPVWPNIHAVSNVLAFN